MVNLTKKFDSKSRDASGADIEKLRADYYIQAKMNGSDDRAIGGVTVNPAGREDSSVQNKKKRDKSIDSVTMLQLLQQQIADLENTLMDRYGEDFDLNLAAEYLDEDTYKDLASIQDPEERRAAIAKAINEGIENGSIDPTEIYNDPELKDWLEKHEEKAQLRKLDLNSDKAFETSLEIDHSETAALDDFFGQPS